MMSGISRVLCMCLCIWGSALSYSWNNPGGMLPAGCRHLTFHSASNNTDIGYVVYLPPNYDSSAASTTRYPVVYSFHGMGGTESGNVSITSTVQSGIKAGKLVPMIWIFVNGHGNSFYADSKDGSIKCETSIVKELVPHVDSLFHTIPDRKCRATHGFSMGGFGSMMMTFKHYDLFTQSVPNSSATVNWDTLSEQQFDQDVPRKIFGSDADYFNDNYYPFTFVEKNADSLKAIGTKVRIVDNRGNVTMGPLYYYNVAMYKLLKSKGISVVFDSTAGNGHVMASGAHLDDLLKFISDNFEVATPVKRQKTEITRLATAVQPSCRSVASVRNFIVPESWHTASRRVAVHSMLGRLLGYEGIEGRRVIHGEKLSAKYGETVLVIKPVTEPR